MPPRRKSKALKVVPQCPVCAHAEVEQIDVALVSGRLTLRAVTAVYAPLTAEQLRAHRDQHLVPDLREVAESHESDAHLATAESVYVTLLQLGETMRKIALDESESGRVRVSASAEARQVAQVIAAAGGMVLDRVEHVISLNDSPEWPVVSSAILRALDPYPDAREAVLEALTSLAAGVPDDARTLTEGEQR